MVSILVNEALALTIDEDTVGQGGGRIKGQTQKALMHVDCPGSDTEPHLYAAARVVGIANGGSVLEKLGTVLRHHRLVHDEAAGTEHHTFASPEAVLLHVDAHDNTDHALVGTVAIDDQAQRPTVVMDINASLFHLLKQDFCQQRPAVITLNFKVVPPGCGRVPSVVGPGLFTSRVQQTVIGEGHHGPLLEFGLFERDAQGHQPLKVRSTPVCIGPGLFRIGLGTIAVHQVAINGLDTVVIAHGLLDGRAAAQVDFRRGQFGTSPGGRRRFQDSNRGAPIMGCNCRTGTGAAKTHDHDVTVPGPGTDIRFQYWSKRHTGELTVASVLGTH